MYRLNKYLNYFSHKTTYETETGYNREAQFHFMQHNDNYLVIYQSH